MVLASMFRRHPVTGSITFLTCAVATYLLLVGPWFGHSAAIWRLGGSQKGYEAGGIDTLSEGPSPSLNTPLKEPDLSETDPSKAGDDAPKPNRILLVSALYPLAKSKHSQTDYEQWLRRFLGEITADIYFYAPPSLETLVLDTFNSRATQSHNSSHSPRASPQLRSQFFKLNMAHKTAFSIPPLHGLEGVYESMHQKDRENHRHSPELYAIWNAKPFFLNTAVRELEERGREYDYAFWVDAGSFREEHTFNEWPDTGRVEEVFKQSRSREDAIFFPIWDPPGYRFRTWQEEMGPVDDEVSEGSFFGGSPHAIQWYTSTFYKYHDHYLSLGHFVGKDQTLINALFLLFPWRFITLWRRDPTLRTKFWPSGKCGNKWYYYEFALARGRERAGIEGIWEENMSWFWKALKGWVPGGSERCPLLQGLAMDSLLAKTFGERWKGVNATLE